MKRSILIAALLLLTTVISCEKKGPSPTSIKFITDFNEAKSIAAKSDKPMIIDFFTDWCHWCDSLDANTYSDSLVISMSAKNIFVKINAEVDSNLAEEYAVSGFPTIIITNSKGEEIDRIWGYAPPTEFYNQVQLYLQGKETLEDYLTRLEDEPENLDYLLKAGEKYASRSKSDKAIEYYEKIIKIDNKNEEGYGASAVASIYDTQARSRDYKTAIKTCMRLLRLFPDSPEADDAAAEVGYYTERSGDKIEALKIYKGYLKMNPESENIEWVKKRISEIEGE